MKIEFDQVKSEKNRQERNLPFEQAAEFDWADASYAEDVRNPFLSVGSWRSGIPGDRLHVLCSTSVPGGVRIISFRKANDREAKRYGKALTTD